MSTATLSRGNTSVTLTVSDVAGTPLIAADAGRPNLNIWENGEINPRFNDSWSGTEQFTVVGNFDGASAFADAASLADLIKEGVGDPAQALTVDLPTSEFDSNISVAPAIGTEDALTLTYNSGVVNFVNVELSLTRISETRGAVDQTASTPTASGTGPVQLGDGSTTVDLDVGLQVTRTVGRPESQAKKTTAAQYPNHYDKHKTAYDAFEIQTNFTDSAVSTVNDMRGLFDTKLGRSALSLDFQGQFGLGEFKVVPAGSGALRHIQRAGETDGHIPIPTVQLRRVRDDL